MTKKTRVTFPVDPDDPQAFDAASRPQQQTQVTFALTASTKLGEKLMLCGSHVSVGAWNPHRALELTTTDCRSVLLSQHSLSYISLILLIHSFFIHCLTYPPKSFSYPHWELLVMIPRDIKFTYKYFIRREDGHIDWEDVGQDKSR